MNKMKNILFLISLILPVFILGQATPAPKQTYSILLYGGTAHLGDGTLIEDAAIGFDHGVISFVGSMHNVNQSDWNQVVNTEGKQIYPGFIAPNSTFGLMEIGAVRATKDYREVGRIKPNVRSLIAYNTESEITPTGRSNGVLMGQITPRGGVISGTSSVVQFDAWNWEDAVVREDDGVHLNWPRVFSKKRDKGKITIEEDKRHTTSKEEIYTFFEKSKAYFDNKNSTGINAAVNTSSESTEMNLKYEAMLGIWSGEKNLYIHAHDVKQITDAVNFTKQFKIKKVVIVGGNDSYLVADLLNDNHIPVMVQRVTSLPDYQDDDYDLPYRLPVLLDEAGILFCLENSGDMEQMQTRNLPFYAGLAVGFGLDHEKAIQVITSNAAKILGIDSRFGLLKKGMSATLFVSEGDALDMRTNEVIFAVIDGRKIVLDNRQKELYYKYKSKYRQEGLIK